MPSLRHLTPLASVAAALTLAVAGALAPDADAAAKPAAPTLKISSKLCSIGPLEDDRFLKFDVASGPGTGDARPAFRIRVQSRETAKDRWTKVPTTPTETEIDGWEIATKANAIVAATKTLGPLEEGRQHRVLVDSRGYTAAGKPATRMATRTLACNQPLFTPSFRLSAVGGASTSAGYEVTATVRNAGRLESDDGILTVLDAATRQPLGTTNFDGLGGGARQTVAVTFPTCPGKLYVKVQPVGADPTDLQPEQYTTIDCSATRSQSRSRR